MDNLVQKAKEEQGKISSTHGHPFSDVEIIRVPKRRR